MKTKNKLVFQSIGIKEDAKNVMFLSKKKGIYEHIAPMDFAEHLRKSNVSDNCDVYFVDFYEMDIMSDISILVKVYGMYNI